MERIFTVKALPSCCTGWPGAGDPVDPPSVLLEEVTDELIRRGDRLWRKVCHYLDIPIQHASGRILRHGAQDQPGPAAGDDRELRREIPDIALRTTLISGFPRETQEEITRLMAFVDEMNLRAAGRFAYSAEEDTPASFPD